MIHLIIIGQGCSNQLDDSHSENKEDIKTRSFSYCPGNKECIPVVVVQHFGSYSSTPGTLISWSGNIVDNCNFFTLEVKCKTINYNATHYIQPSGSIYLSHNLDEYTLDYKIGYSSDSRCVRCKEGATFVKKKNNNGQMGDYGDCQKRYMSYSVVPGPYNSGFKLICTSPDYIKNNLNEYLAVDNYKIFTSNYGEQPQMVQQGTIIPDGSIIYHPCEPLKYYETRFYSSKCDHSEEHFIYGTYSWQQCDMGQGLSIPYLQERLHPGGGI
jgi:hypothetical protein